ncbi:MAG: outer membrane protein assembly factor BamD [Alphaproteobacteria bacterium]|nr:outer membrane protein assembly factor BamD [Alphaproteobacteria bacterium]
MKKITLLLLLMISACARTQVPVVDDSYQEETVADLYIKAKSFLDNESYQSAVEAFEELERQHPYSVWATKSQLMSAYSYYKNMKYDDALLALDRYIELHPVDKDIAYAYYLRALCYYEQIQDVTKDQTVTELALYSMDEVIRRFPKTSYAKDAKLKIDLTKTNLAGQQMSIGRYYLNRKFYNAAINRFNNVVKDYQTTAYIEEALYRLVESYLSIGIYTEAKKMGAILSYNYPNSEWYRLAYNLLKENNLADQ